MKTGKLAPCSRCSSDDLRKSRYRLLEHPLKLLGIRPFRCMDCGKRLYALRSSGVSERLRAQ